MATFRSLNKVILIGNLGSDPQDKSTQSGSQFTTFSLATNEFWTDKQGNKKQRTDWHNIVAWGNLAKDCLKYLKKGSLVYIEGSVRNREWSDKQGTSHKSVDIQAAKLVVLDGATGSQQPEQPQETSNFPDDDLPF